jgi:hypothetical protein
VDALTRDAGRWLLGLFLPTATDQEQRYGAEGWKRANHGNRPRTLDFSVKAAEK